MPTQSKDKASRENHTASSWLSLLGGMASSPAAIKTAVATLLMATVSAQETAPLDLAAGTPETWNDKYGVTGTAINTSIIALTMVAPYLYNLGFRYLHQPKLQDWASSFWMKTSLLTANWGKLSPGVKINIVRDFFWALTSTAWGAKHVYGDPVEDFTTHGFDDNLLTCAPHMAVAALWTLKRLVADTDRKTSHILEPLIAGLAACVGLFAWNIPLGAGMSSNQYDGAKAWLGSTLAVGAMEAVGQLVINGTSRVVEGYADRSLAQEDVSRLAKEMGCKLATNTPAGAYWLLSELMTGLAATTDSSMAIFKSVLLALSVASGNVTGDIAAVHFERGSKDPTFWQTMATNVLAKDADNPTDAERNNINAVLEKMGESRLADAASAKAPLLAETTTPQSACSWWNPLTWCARRHTAASTPSLQGS